MHTFNANTHCLLAAGTQFQSLSCGALSDHTPIPLKYHRAAQTPGGHPPSHSHSVHSHCWSSAVPRLSPACPPQEMGPFRSAGATQLMGQPSSSVFTEARRIPQSWWDSPSPATVSWHGSLSSCQFRGTKGPWRGLREQKGLCAAVHLESLAWGAGGGVHFS